MVKSYVNGTLNCFCADEYQENGLAIFTKQYRLDGLDQDPAELESFRVKLDTKGLDDDVQTSQICRQYLIYQQFSDYYYWITSTTILVYNYMFQMLTKPVLSHVGFHLRT